MKKNQWKAPHPPVRSINFTNVVGKKLTDRQIKKYMKLGYYGVEAMEKLIAREKKGKRRIYGKQIWNERN